MIRKEKQILRAQMKAALMAFPGKHEASEALRARLVESAAWRAAKVVYGFPPLRSEPDWLGSHWPAGKVLAFPRVAEGGLEFFAGRNFAPGRHGTREPDGGEPAPPPDLVLVPGLAFDRSGRRLGRGGGYFDRFLEKLSTARPTLCGICFDCQIVPAIPHESHDIQVDRVLTESGWIGREAG